MSKRTGRNHAPAFKAKVALAAVRARNDREHERQRRLLRQRGGRELFLDARVRAAHEERLAHAGECATRNLPLYRDMVQPQAAPFYTRVRQSGGV